ncbi:zinc ribbon domain-containing protein [Komagataeibacter medellinensis]|uniref:zinc ribbon domain-containing protein n=1 Tax=Komagataeibacter medellinensis TaxID=1177712 RepID=UPI001E36240B|nr:recombinase zinc beta ribbon domain-containing protein [Komagataeibacter medellinensis]
MFEHHVGPLTWGRRPLARRKGSLTLGRGYRYYTCSIKARQGETGCSGRSIPMPQLDAIVCDHIENRLLQPERLEDILASILDRREERADHRREHIAELNRRAAETELRLKRLYEAIESGVADLNDPALKERVVALRALRDQAQAQLESSGQMAMTPAALRTFATSALKRLRQDGGGYRRDHLRAFAQRVEVGETHIRIIGSKGELLRTLTAVSGGKSACPLWDRNGGPCGIRTLILNQLAGTWLFYEQMPTSKKSHGLLE